MKIKITFLLIACCCIEQYASSQSLRYPVSMPYISSGAYSRFQNNVFSFTGNQAALAEQKNDAIGIYGEQRFLLEDNSSYELAAAFHTLSGNFGLKFNYAGFSDFNENLIGLAYARSLGSKVDIGIQFNYYGYRIPAYGHASTVNFEAGVILHLTEKINAGMHIYNPVGSKLKNKSDEKLASIYSFGLGYDASAHFFIGIETIKEENMPLNVTGEVQYQFEKQFFIRTGFVTDTGSEFGGAGVSWKNIRLDIAINYNPLLGLSPGMSLIANLNSKK